MLKPPAPGKRPDSGSNVLLRGLVDRGGLLRGVDVGEQVEAEADLGDEVDDGDDADLLRQTEGAGALRAHDPDDGVDDPGEDGEPGESLERVAAVALGVVEALKEVDEDDDEEDEAAHPPQVLVRGDGESADERTDHVQDNAADEGKDGRSVRAGQERQVGEDELSPWPASVSMRLVSFSLS